MSLVIFTFNAFAFYKVNSLSFQYYFLIVLNTLFIFFLFIGNKNAITIPLLLLTYIYNANIFLNKLIFLPLLLSPITSFILTIVLALIIFRALLVNTFIFLILLFFLYYTSNCNSRLKSKYTSLILVGFIISKATYMFNTIIA